MGMLGVKINSKRMRFLEVTLVSFIKTFKGNVLKRGEGRETQKQASIRPVL